MPERRLRADAQQNHDRLLEVAARHFAAHGADISMKAIAQEAGVGVGTLYRRFPSREVLVEATYRNESRRLCDAAVELAREHEPLDALRAWATMFLDYMATKAGMADSLKALLHADEPLRLATATMLINTLADLLRAGEAAGTVRPGLDAFDVVTALGGLAMITDDRPLPGQRGRLLDLLLHGLATRSS